MTGVGALPGGFGMFPGGIAAIWWASMQEDDRKAPAQAARRIGGAGQAAAND